MLAFQRDPHLNTRHLKLLCGPNVMSLRRFSRYGGSHASQATEHNEQWHDQPMQMAVSQTVKAWQMNLSQLMVCDNSVSSFWCAHWIMLLVCERNYIYILIIYGIAWISNGCRFSAGYIFLNFFGGFESSDSVALDSFSLGLLGFYVLYWVFELSDPSTCWWPIASTFVGSSTVHSFLPSFLPSFQSP